jgi:MAF protein
MPRALASRLARTKALDARDAVANDKDIADAYVLAADTVVAVGRRILVKPRFVEEAIAALRLLSGRSHRVLTALCLVTPDDRVRVKIVDTRVRFKRLTADEIEAYIASREWRGKAGGYAVQGLAGCFVQKISGSYTNVVGLPLTETVNLLMGEGFPIHFNWLKLGETDPEEPCLHNPQVRVPRSLPNPPNARSAAGRAWIDTSPSARAAAPMWIWPAGSPAPTPSPTRRKARTAGRGQTRDRPDSR